MGTQPGGLSTAPPLTFGLAVVLLLAVGPVWPPWRSQGPELDTAAMTVVGVPLTVEVADEPAETARGLGYRAGLEPGKGMLFVYEAASERSFWMKGMRFCLDIVWIEGGRVV